MTFWEVVKQAWKTFKSFKHEPRASTLLPKKLRKDICSVINIEESHFEYLKTKRAKNKELFLSHSAWPTSPH